MHESLHLTVKTEIEKQQQQQQQQQQNKKRNKNGKTTFNELLLCVICHQINKMYLKMVIKHLKVFNTKQH